MTASIVLLGAAGCGSSLSTLEGTVTIDGQPAEEGLSLQFTPVEGGGSPSYATTDADGRYEAKFSFREAGIQPGEHSVRLVPGSGQSSSSMPVIGPDGKPVAGSEEPAPAAQLPEDYYQEITKLQVEPGRNAVDIALETDDTNRDG